MRDVVERRADHLARWSQRYSVDAAVALPDRCVAPGRLQGKPQKLGQQDLVDAAVSHDQDPVAWSAVDVLGQKRANAGLHVAPALATLRMPRHRVPRRHRGPGVAGSTVEYAEVDLPERVQSDRLGARMIGGTVQDDVCGVSSTGQRADQHPVKPVTGERNPKASSLLPPQVVQPPKMGRLPLKNPGAVLNGLAVPHQHNLAHLGHFGTIPASTGRREQELCDRKRAMIVLRVARPTDRLAELAEMYVAGLGLQVLGHFEDHDGFDGIMVGAAGAPYHLEFTTQRGHPAGGAASPEHLLIFYVVDAEQWAVRCDAMLVAGFVAVAAHNPYWDRTGRTFEDIDGYRVVLQRGVWPAQG